MRCARLSVWTSGWRTLAYTCPGSEPSQASTALTPSRITVKPSPFTIRSTARSFRSEEHTSELQSLMRISYAVFCLKKNKNNRYLLQTSSHANNNRPNIKQDEI